jgi:HNH endonuclease
VASVYLHVHHLRPLSQAGGARAVDPVADLRPVCPNCHAVLHRREPVFSIEELRELVRQQKHAEPSATADPARPFVSGDGKLPGGGPDS